MFAAVVIDGAAGLTVGIAGYLLGRFHQARRGSRPRHVRVDVRVGDDDDTPPGRAGLR